jgi:hypothetical protein
MDLYYPRVQKRTLFILRKRAFHNFSSVFSQQLRDLLVSFQFLDGLTFLEAKLAGTDQKYNFTNIHVRVYVKILRFSLNPELNP